MPATTKEQTVTPRLNPNVARSKRGKGGMLWACEGAGRYTSAGWSVQRFGLGPHLRRWHLKHPLLAPQTIKCGSLDDAMQLAAEREATRA